MTSIRNSTVLITGGASGIGKLMYQKCLQRGMLPTRVYDTVAGPWIEVYDSINHFWGHPTATPAPGHKAATH